VRLPSRIRAIAALFSMTFAVLVVINDSAVYSLTQLPAARASSSFTAIPLKDYVGVNVAVNNNAAEVAQVAGWARDYHKWYWYEAVEGTYSWDSGWQYVARYYDALAAKGVRIMPSVEYFPDWASTANPGWINGPNGYPKPDKQANYLAALVLRFGNKLGAIENYNEPNENWIAQQVFPPDKYGEMTIAGYNAVKAVDPSMLFVEGGTSGTGLGPVNYPVTPPGANVLWRPQAHSVIQGKLDVVNFHWYAGAAKGTLPCTGCGGKNPESGGFQQELAKMQAWRDQIAPGKPIWLTEFGWDTAVGSGINPGRVSDLYAPELSSQLPASRVPVPARAGRRAHLRVPVSRRI